MNNTPILLALLTGLLAATPSPAQPRHAAAESTVTKDAAFRRDFSAFLTAGMARFPSIPALSVAVVHSDRPVMIAAFGSADREARLRADAATRFYIASSTKSFVALALVRLAERGEINLDWTLADLAPDISFAPGVQPERMTLRHLLSHSHGLRGDPLQFRLAYSGDWDQPTLWRLLATLQPNPKAPLGTFAYSNLGYNVAALLIERRLGRPWQSIVEQEVIVPLGLRDTATRGLDRAADRAAPYDGMQRLYLHKTDRTMQSAGGMESSARDMARWIGANLAAERGGTDALAPAMRTTHARFVPTEASFGPFTRTGYGLGWYSGPYQSQILYHSFGGFTGFRAHGSFLPDQDLGVAVMSNDDGAGYWFVDIAATYAYDWYRAGPDAARVAAGDRLDALQRRMGDAAKTGQPATVPVLSLPASAYAGRYCNAEWGTIVVAAKADGIDLRMGVLQAPATGDTPDTIRTELIPGRRSKVAFTIADRTAGALTAFGAKFVRCASDS